MGTIDHTQRKIITHTWLMPGFCGAVEGCVEWKTRQKKFRTTPFMTWPRIERGSSAEPACKTPRFSKGTPCATRGCYALLRPWIYTSKIGVVVLEINPENGVGNGTQRETIRARIICMFPYNIIEFHYSK